MTLLLDIETTGLYWRTSYITYIGCAFQEKQAWQYQEWKLEKEEDEPDILLKLSDFLKNFETLITYHGSSFDLPYLKNKFHAYRILDNLDHLNHLDLYLELSPFKQTFQFLSMKQIDVEHFLNYSRLDSEPGADLRGMCEITKFLPYLSLFKGSFSVISCERINLEHLIITCTPLEELPFAFSRNLSPFYIHATPNSLKIQILLFEDTLKGFFPDYKNYYYLPAEDKAIHKSIGTYVPKNRRTSAKASNCYQHFSGFFLPKLFEDERPTFKREYSDKKGFLLFQDSLINDFSFWKEYILKILH